MRPRRRSRWTSEKRLAAKGVKYRYSGVDPGRGRDGQSTRVSRTAGSSALQLSPATATRGPRLRSPLRGDEGYRDESADLSIHQSVEILSNTLVIQGKLANEL